MVAKALAPAVSRGLHAHEPRVLAILEIADQHAILDQGGALAGGAFIVHAQRAAAIGDGAVVHHGDAAGRDALAQQAGKRAGLLAVEIAFQPVTDGLMEQNAGPARAEHDGHFARGRRHRGKIDQGLAQRLVGRGLPGLGPQIKFIAGAPAGTIAAAFHAAILLDHDGDVQPDEGADIGRALAVAAQDLDSLPAAAERGRNLAHPRVLCPDIGVQIGEQRGLGRECHAGQRVVLAIEAAVRARRGLGQCAAAPAMHSLHCLGGARHRRLAQVAGMGKARRLAGDRAQAETLGRIEAGALQLAVVETQRLRLAVFQEHLAILGAAERLGGEALDARAIESGLGEKEIVGLGKRVHSIHSEFGSIH